MTKIDKLLEDVKNKFWNDRIKRSVQAVLHLYHLSVHDVSLSRKEIPSDELYVTAVEECNLEKSKEYMEKHPKIPPPITVIQHRHKKCIFLGSNRSIQYVLHKKNPDCIIVKLPHNIHPRMILEATITLKDLIAKQIK